MHQKITKYTVFGISILKIFAVLKKETAKKTGTLKDNNKKHVEVVHSVECIPT